MPESESNKVIELASHPSGVPVENTFRLRKIDMPDVNDGDVLLKSLYVSVDPGMRGFMEEGKSATGVTFNIGDPITSRTVAKVVESKNGKYDVGDIVHGRLAWKQYQLSSTDNLEQVDPNLAPISTAVSTLGVTGLAAYFGMTKIGNPRKGETVVVSGAAGAVGSIAAQIGKIKGCRVIGIAGSDKKISYLEDELGIDKGINYKTTDDMEQALDEACSNGVDVYFDNVGGTLSDEVLKAINKHARIVICGQIAEYNAQNPPVGPRPQHRLIKKSAKMEGFVVFDFENEFDKAKTQLAQWLGEDRLKHRETIVQGFENIPSAFIGLFSGENIGKLLVQVAEIP